MPDNDFEARRQAAADALESEREEVRDEISRLKKKRGLLKGQSAPTARIEGLTARIEAAESHLETLEDTDPVDRVEKTSDKDPRPYGL